MSQPISTHSPTGMTYTSEEAVTDLNRISWGAVFAGVVIALATQFLLNLLGVGIGAAVLDPATADNPTASSFSIIGGLWFVVAGIVASFIGAYVASRLSGRPSETTGGFHGVTSWAATTLVVLYLLTTSVGALVGGAFSGLSSVVGGAGQAAASAVSAAAPTLMPSDPMTAMEAQIRDTSGGSDPQALQATALSAMKAVTSGDPSKVADDKTRAAEALAKAQNIPVDQARAKVDEYEARYRETLATAKQEALNAAQTTATIVSRGALLGFLALVLGVVAAWFGGVAGTKPVTVVQEYTLGRKL
jgi:hypothetical protein